MKGRSRTMKKGKKKKKLPFSLVFSVLLSYLSMLFVLLGWDGTGREEKHLGKGIGRCKFASDTIKHWPCLL